MCAAAHPRVPGFGLVLRSRGITYDDGANAVAAFLFVFISNFLVEFLTITVRYVERRVARRTLPAWPI